MSKLNSEFRIDSDSIGEVNIDNQYHWGSQTERSRKFFDIVGDNMPEEVIKSLAIIKRCAALSHKKMRKLDSKIADHIIKAADNIIDGKLQEHFPLTTWQTGSGTQSNMNVNEVIASICNYKITGIRGGKDPVHPNDHVNMGQSSNDSFSTAMHIAVILTARKHLIPSIKRLIDSLNIKSKKWSDIIKIGRTHLQDATPMTLGQEFATYSSQIEYILKNIESALNDLLIIPQGGTAIGTGINCHDGFSEIFANFLSKYTGYKFTIAENKFSLISSHDSLVNFSSSINILAVSVMKIANDIRMLASGPSCGIGELKLPQNEPGSSIMPGKVNPTQCESITMIAAQIMGNNLSVTIAGSNGHFQLNTFKPLIIYNILQSINLFGQSIDNFTKYCIDGIELNLKKISEFREKSLMVVTALVPHIGYDNAAKIAKKAASDDLTLKNAALKLGLLSEEEFNRYVKLENML